MRYQISSVTRFKRTVSILPAKVAIAVAQHCDPHNEVDVMQAVRGDVTQITACNFEFQPGYITRAVLVIPDAAASLTAQIGCYACFGSYLSPHVHTLASIGNGWY